MKQVHHIICTLICSTTLIATFTLLSAQTVYAGGGIAASHQGQILDGASTTAVTSFGDVQTGPTPHQYKAPVARSAGTSWWGWVLGAVTSLSGLFHR